MPLLLIDVGEGFSAVVRYQKWEKKEPHFNRGHEAVGLKDYNTSTTIHHWVASLRMRSSHQPAISPSPKHQALHG